MARGKNKGGKKEAPDSTKTPSSESQPSESQPSTSQIPTTEPTTTIEDDLGGLGLGESRKRRPRKKPTEKQESLAQAELSNPKLTQTDNPKAEVPKTEAPKTEALKPEAPIPEACKSEAPKSEESKIETRGSKPEAAADKPQDDDDGLGLGLGGGGRKKTRSRKPKFTAVETDIKYSKAPSSEPAIPGPSQSKPITSTASQPIQYVQNKPEVKVAPAAPVLYKIPDKILSPPSRTVPILTNYLAMKITKPLKIYRYDVTFKPDKPKKFIAQVFKLVKSKEFPKEILAFDQTKNCYSLTPLPKITTERYGVKVVIKDMNGKDMPFEVSFKASGIVDYNNVLKHMATGGSSLNAPTDTIQCIDIVLKQGTLESYVKADRQYFMRPASPIDLGDGLEMWTGLFQSAIFTSKAFINVDVAHKGFPKNQPMIDAFTRDFRLDPNRPMDRQPGRAVEAFNEFIRGLKVVSKILGTGPSSGQLREHICNGVVDPPSRQTFTLENDKGPPVRMTVYEYFMKEKKYRIKYPDLNCLWVGPKDKNIYLPMELVEVAYGQARNKQLNDRQLSTMVREAATPPDVRKRKIEEVIQKMNYSKNQFFKTYGLEIANEFYQVEAKILEAPTLEVGPRQFTVPKKGVWQANCLLKPEALNSWGFIAIELDPRGCNYEDIVSKLMNTGRQMGMNVTQPKMACFNIRINDLHKSMLHALEKQVNFLVVVVSGRGRDYYHKLKQIAELKVGILTQCIKEDTATRRMNPQTARNILLKVNSKLMGINQALENRSIPQCLKGGAVMIVGADVTHPSPDQSNIPSIAAVTASMDTKCYIYNIELSIQTPKKEMIVQFEDIMVDHFHAFKKSQGILPKKVFVFRDGVSEGQFAEVMKSELTGLHRAYQRVAGLNAKPEVLFILVQKRHHTRFFLPGNNARFNVDPGTVVDRDIVHPRELDFYLVSHQAIKGTARPTRYHAVCNDGRIPENEVEHLAYYLCHLYARCMRAVSYPAPTYYAHLACLRARSLTYGEIFNNNDLEKNPKRLRVLDSMLKQSRMFFV
ncbi:argonaute 2 isoform X1 [Bombyx mori]|uniref:Uncharacterized protein n=2 Tax=Bombyx mori TaxID=7091 RepID=A0A8R2C7N2_BOMMO|nr:argonaute 2 isoform X1 [Bombyx mori]